MKIVGCITNGKQKKLLKSAGVKFTQKNLLTEPWSAARLREFFSGIPVNEWINPNAPQVKSGEFSFSGLTEDTALAAMIKEPLLIRRPLFEYGELRWYGFDWKKICQITGLLESAIPDTDVPEGCSQTNEHSECP